MTDAKRARGRPKKNGNLPLKADVVETHERLRMSGLGRNDAITRTVAEVKNRHPCCRLSATAVKNILSEWQPENGFLFEVGSPGKWRPGVFRVEKEVIDEDIEYIDFEGNLVTLPMKGKESLVWKFSYRPAFRKRGDQISRKNNFQYGRKKRLT